MKKLVIATAVAAVMATTSVAVAAEPLSVKNLNEVVDQTNFIVDGGCSGTLISVEHKLVITAHHCIDGKIRWIEKSVVEDGEVKKKKVEVRQTVNLEQKVYKGSTQVGGALYKAEILAYSNVNGGYDLALLQIQADKIPMTLDVPMLPKEREAMRAERVYVVGNPAGMDASITQGIIVSTTREFPSSNGTKLQMLQTDAEIFYGNSGGSLVSADGFYMGTVSRGIVGTAVVFAIHYKHIRDMLTENCFAELYDAKADSFALCDTNRKSKKDAKEKSVKDLLKEIVDQHNE